MPPTRTSPLVYSGTWSERRFILLAPHSPASLAYAVALRAIAARDSELGLSPNRVAALGENVILLVNLSWSAVLYIRFLRGNGSFTDCERWQTSYIRVYAVWAAIVVVALPPVFGFT